MDVKSLRARASNDFSKITQELEKIANPESNRNREDDRFWKLERDKSGNGSAIIRFLPKTENDELPWVKRYSHGFQGPTGRWYIEDSLSTIGEEDGVSVLNRELWNSGVEANKDQARRQKRRLAYVSNILVISDPKKPENEGKVFLFRYGSKIFDKIMDAARPTFEDDKPINAFDLWEGANFKLRIKTVDDFPNYDQSTFESQSELFGGDEDKLNSILKQLNPLNELVDPKNFKSRAELDKKLAWVMEVKQTPTAKTAEEKLSDMGIETNIQLNEKISQEPEKKASPEPERKSASVEEDNIDDYLAQFNIDD